MEPISTFALAAMILASRSGAEELGREAGHSTWAGLAKLKSLVVRKFQSDDQARAALVYAEQDPRDKQAVARLEQVIADHAAQDTSFAAQLQQLVDAAQQRPEYKSGSGFFANYGWAGQINVFQAPIHLAQGDFRIN